MPTDKEGTLKGEKARWEEKVEELVRACVRAASNFNEGQPPLSEVLAKVAAEWEAQDA